MAFAQYLLDKDLILGWLKTVWSVGRKSLSLQGLLSYLHHVVFTTTYTRTFYTKDIVMMAVLIEKCKLRRHPHVFYPFYKRLTKYQICV